MTALIKIPWMHLTGEITAFALKSRLISIRGLGRQFGVCHVLDRGARRVEP